MNPGRGSRRIVGLRGDGCWRCKKSWSFFERVGHIGATPATIIAPLRPGLNEQATDPLPVMTDHSVGWLDSSDSGASGPLKAGRPLLKEAKSTPAVPETKPGGPLRGEWMAPTLPISGYPFSSPSYVCSLSSFADTDTDIVLVVEDNGVNRKILTTMLKRTVCRLISSEMSADIRSGLPIRRSRGRSRRSQQIPLLLTGSRPTRYQYAT